MQLLISWLVLPALFGMLAFGLGLLVEAAGGHRLPVPLLLGVGFCAMVCLTQALVSVPALAPATPWVTVAVALAGLAVGRKHVRSLTLDRPAVALALAVFVGYALPTVLTGHATFLGYGNLGDAGFHFQLVDRLMSHGPSVEGLPYSSYKATVDSYLDTAYPTGTHTALGALRGLTGSDVAWLLQPYLTLLVVLSAVGLYGLVARGSTSRWLAALAAGLAASAGLVYAYANNQQALKEMGALVVIVTLVGTVPVLLAARPTVRAGLPAAVVVGAGLATLSLALAPWLGPVLLFAAVALLVRHRRRRGAVLLEFAGFGVAAVILSLPALLRLDTFVAVTRVSLTIEQELGNLLGPLPFMQVFGVWPADDFRLPITPGLDAGYLLLGAVALAALFGFIIAIRRGDWTVILFAAVSLIGYLAVAGRASPWAAGKALMLLSPAALLLAGVAVIGLWEGRRRAEAGALGVVLLIGVAWTDALAWHGSSAAPTARLEELADIGERFAGEGPLLYLEAEEFAKHFLRDTAPTGASEAFRLPGIEYANDGFVRFGYNRDVDELVPASLSQFELMLLRVGPAVSRPSSGWTLRYAGDSYNVWGRDARQREVLAHESSGSELQASGTMSCERVRSVAEIARRAGGDLAFAPRPRAAVLNVATAPRPAGWLPYPGSETELLQIGQGRIAGPVTTPGGTLHAWLHGSVARPATISVDGRAVGVAEDALSFRPAPIPVGSIDLAPGEHELEVFVGGGELVPGNGGMNRVIGPVSLTTTADPTDVPVRTVAPADWRAACQEPVDWVEAVR